MHSFEVDFVTLNETNPLPMIFGLSTLPPQFQNRAPTKNDVQKEERNILIDETHNID
jgi:hypothetical protein